MVNLNGNLIVFFLKEEEEVQVHVSGFLAGHFS